MLEETFLSGEIFCIDLYFYIFISNRIVIEADKDILNILRVFSTRLLNFS